MGDTSPRRKSSRVPARSPFSTLFVFNDHALRYSFYRSISNRISAVLERVLRSRRRWADVLQPPVWSGTPVKAGDYFTLHKKRGDRAHVAVCELWSHLFGWELKLVIDGELQRSQVCRTADAWLDTADKWRAAMLEKGWG